MIALITIHTDTMDSDSYMLPFVKEHVGTINQKKDFQLDRTYFGDSDYIKFAYSK